MSDLISNPLFCHQDADAVASRLCKAIYDKLVESRLVLFRTIQSQLPDRPHSQINEAAVKLLFRIMFIRFAENKPHLPEGLLAREIGERFEQGRKRGGEATLYGCVQQYLARLDGRNENRFGMYPCDGDLFDTDPILDDPQLRIDDGLIRNILSKLSPETMGRPIDYRQIDPRILGKIYERFLEYVIEIKERRLGPRAESGTRRKEGTFYTPQSIARFLVEHAVNEALARFPGRKPWELVCLDPACGSGHFLIEYVNYVAARCEELDGRRSYQQWKRYITQHGVFGVDKDSTAVMLTKLSLWINAAMQDEPFVAIDTHIKCGNSLVCGPPPGFRLANFAKKAYPERFRELQRLRKELAELESCAAADGPLFTGGEVLGLHARFAAPWPESKRPKGPSAENSPARCGNDARASEQQSLSTGKSSSPRSSRSKADSTLSWETRPGAPTWPKSATTSTADFCARRGQFDSYELFIELGRRLLREGGMLGFIIPDSITLPEHELLRRMLLEQTALTRLLRAGEGIFPSVFRAAFFLCFANRPPPPGQRIRVGTLRKAHREATGGRRTWRSDEDDRGRRQRYRSRADAERLRANPRAELDGLAADEDRTIVA